MSMSPSHKTRTLWLAGVLHAFTHVYNVALLPLYFLIQQDFKLAGIEKATLLVTAMMLAYCLPSYPQGILADRFSRKKLLAWGLAINALGFIGLAYAPNYTWALLSVLIAGVGGSCYHPAALSMIARLCPVKTGKAFGLVGMGSSIGQFFGPIYSGWRAEMSGNWRAPVLELGLFGLVAALLFAWLAEEEPAPAQSAHSSSPQAQSPPQKLFPSPALWLIFLGACLAFSLRDFAGTSMGSLGSLFLQRAHGFSLKTTGLALSGLFIASAISNPLFGGLSDRGRIRWTCFVLSIATVIVMVYPHLHRSLLIPVYVVYGFFFMASYPMVESALMQSVPDAIRGRVMGLFITFGGALGNLSHWLVGRFVQQLGPIADHPAGFYDLYAAMGFILLFSLLGLACLHALGRREQVAPTPGFRLQSTGAASPEL